MYYRVIDIATVEDGTGHTYALVEYWRTQADFDAGAPPVLRNDFIFNWLRDTAQRIVRDAQGRLKRADGVFVVDGEETDADNAIGWERETYTPDVPAQLRTEFEAYYRRALARGDVDTPRVDRTDPGLAVSRVDPHGVLSRTDVNALRGSRLEAPDVRPGGRQR